MWSTASTASKIAVSFRGRSTNAIIGKAHRLGLPPKTKRAKKTKTLPAQRSENPKSPSIENAEEPAKTMQAERASTAKVGVGNAPHLQLVPPAPAKVATDKKPPSIAMLESSEKLGIKEPIDGYCKWPFGDPGTPGFCYCGKKCESKRKSFCAEHGVHMQAAPNKEPSAFYFLARRRR